MEVEQKRVKLKRPSLYVIRGLLETVERAPDHKERFLTLATCTPELQNRGRLIQYLRLLVEDLGWLEKKEETRRTSWTPKSKSLRRWTVSWYSMTQAGRTFLGLFPEPRILEDTEDAPFPEQFPENEVASSAIACE
ncbi:MAG: hypothetical protein JRN20_07255 [Nitrososphaerota archaeon]|nr:hypothetical protein [Nitrososphaerota archaeon]